MKRLIVLAVFVAQAASPFGLFAERLLLSDDFSQSALFAERWESIRQGRSAAVLENGRVKLRNTGGIRWTGRLPANYACKVSLLFPVSEAEKRGPRRAGIDTDYGSIFHIYGSGGIAIITHKPASGGRYADVPGFVPGKPVTIEMRRFCSGAMAKCICFVNGELITTFTSPIPENPRPLEITAFNLECEVLSVQVSELDGDGASPNTIVNSGFEYDEDGLPPFMQIHGGFDWLQRPAEEYETKFLKRVTVDRNERHSGRQSLRLTTDCGIDCHIRPFGAGRYPDSKGVFSAWVKAERPGTAVLLRYGAVQKKFTVGTEWTRCEVFCPDIGGRGWQSIATLSVPCGKDGVPRTVWVDDWQVEITDGEQATEYRPIETDAERFAVKPVPAFPRIAAKPLSVSENALNGYVRKEGETVVLGRLNYYMNEREAKFRVWNEKGEMSEHTVDISALPNGTNEVTVGGLVAKVDKRPYRAGVTRINNWTRSLVREGTNLLFTAPCVLSNELIFRHPEKSAVVGPKIVDFLLSKGFRYLHFNCHSSGNDPKAAAALLEYGGRKGMLFDIWTDNEVEKLDDQQLKAYWNSLDHPNVVIRQVLDEPELRGPDDTWAREVFRRARRHFPYDVIMLNGSGLQFSRDFAGGATDVFMVDKYLTNHPDGRTVFGVVNSMDLMRGKRPGTPAWFFLVSDNTSLHYKTPSFDEQIAQSWGVLVSGCSGISWYVNMPHSESTWRAMVQVNREAQEQRAFLLSEEPCGGAAVDVASSVVRVLTRRVGGEWRLYSCNLESSAVPGVNFVMPDDAPRNGMVEVLYENRSLVLKNGTFRDDFPGHARHLYRVVK